MNRGAFPICTVMQVSVSVVDGQKCRLYTYGGGNIGLLLSRFGLH